MNRASEKVIVVTGGASGIGAASVRLLAAEGGKVVFGDINAEAGKKLEAELQDQGLPVCFRETDVRVFEQNEALVNTAVAQFGRLDAIVCCAAKPVYKAMTDFEDEEWIDAIRTTLDAGFYLARFAIPEMIKSGGGSIIFMGDGCMDMPVTKMGCNLASSMGLFYLCRQIGVEHGRDNIRANIITPTLVESDYWKNNPAAWEMVNRVANSKRSFVPEDAAPLVLFLVSDESKMLTVSNLKANDNYDAGFSYDMWAGLHK